MSAANNDNPMTKIWVVALNQPGSTQDETFRSLWKEVATLVYSFSGTERAGHYLWRGARDPTVAVFISGYPSSDSNRRADESYRNDGYLKRVNEFCTHDALYWIDADVNTLVSGDAKQLRLDVSDADGQEGARRGVSVDAREVAGSAALGKTVRIRLVSLRSDEGENVGAPAQRSLVLEKIDL